MGFSELAAASVEATKWLGDRHGGCPRRFGRWPGLQRRWRSACESKPHKVGNVRASEHPGDDSPAWGSCEFPGGVNSPPRVLPSTNNGLVSTRGARRALLPHLIAHSGAGFAFSQKEDFRRSMSSWLARAADLLARVAMNRLRLAFCSRASDLAIYGGLTLDAYCGRRRRSDIWR